MARILLVEDDDNARKALRRILERAGFIITEAANGSEALQFYHAMPVDLVITDILMPERDGLETIMALRKVVSDVKIIAISGGGGINMDVLSVAKQLGACCAFHKPVDIRELLVAVYKLLQR